MKLYMFRTEELSETCRVSFQNKFERLVHLIGFIITIYHDAQPHERKILPTACMLHVPICTYTILSHVSTRNIHQKM